MKQLPLPFAETPGYLAEDFIESPSNEAAREWLARPEAWPEGRLLLWGEAGCGKTHLLHVWAKSCGAVILNGGVLRGLDGLPAGPVAVDDADAVADETALLHLLNAAAEAGQKILLTAAQPPARQRIELPDLASRLRAAQAVEIRPPEDELLAALLTHLAAGRQLTLSIPVRNFLLTRLPRTPAVLREAVARLDRAALASGGRISRQMAVNLLGDLINPAISDEGLLLNGHSTAPQDLV
jgi:chromosomal replication initiation ATPase DnaA